MCFTKKFKVHFWCDCGEYNDADKDKSHGGIPSQLFSNPKQLIQNGNLLAIMLMGCSSFGVFSKLRHIMSPGWTLGWNWAKKEVIWSMVGAQTTEQGDCSKFKGGNAPHCCKRDPVVVDLLPGVPYNQQIANCCKGGVVSSWGQDPSAAVSAFQVSVGLSGTTNKTVKLPKNFSLLAPGPG
ncbi:hypothetical protein L1987_53137 [Smallanthus sonchifolius]|uniref:Uncharacterized protein n=1 Tax=Smallanthus sonchifolius TaxID=185202 RepID=A0ACB9EVH8_9ASTR|nr:hypothetical protein L1987_53137 [Smallanthus sonchifolius]